jgi:hypothetical protein
MTTLRSLSAGDTVKQRRLSDRIEFLIGGEPFTSYVFGDDAAPRPYFYPLIGPGGGGLTRRFPMETGDPAEPTDHPHHRSLWAAYGEVNGQNNWEARAGHAVTRFRRFEETHSEDTLIAHSDWLDSQGRLLCRERLEVTIVPLSNGNRLLDWRIALTAPDDAPVTFGDTKEGGLCAVRLAAPLQGDRGGRIENADGAVGEAECWGKASRWCACSGRLSPGENEAGIAILNHPDGFGYPARFHVRSYGLFAANPIARRAFDPEAEPGDVTLAPGDTVYYHAAVVVFRGSPRDAGLEELWQQFAGISG